RPPAERGRDLLGGGRGDGRVPARPIADVIDGGGARRGHGLRVAALPQLPDGTSPCHRRPGSLPPAPAAAPRAATGAMDVAGPGAPSRLPVLVLAHRGLHGCA